MMHRWLTSIFALCPLLHSLHLSEMLKSEALRAERTSLNLWLSHNHVILTSSAQLPALFSLLPFLPHLSLHSPRAALQFSPPLLALSRSLPRLCRYPICPDALEIARPACAPQCSAQHTLPPSSNHMIFRFKLRLLRVVTST